MATIEYEDIQLKVSSKLTGTGIDNAIQRLKELSDAFGEISRSDIKQSAADANSFAQAIKSIPASTVKSYKELASAMQKIASNYTKALRGAKVAQEGIAKETKDNLIKLPGADNATPKIELLDFKKQREEAQALQDKLVDIPKSVSPIKLVDKEEIQEAMQSKEELDAVVQRAADRYRQNNSVVSEERFSLEQEYRDAADAYYSAKREYEESLQRNLEETAGGGNTKAGTNLLETLKTDLLLIKDSLGLASDGIKDKIGDIKDRVKEAFSPEPVKAFNKAIKDTHKSTGGLLGQLAKIARYRFLRGLISGIASGAKEGIANLEQWDKTKGLTGFVESMRMARESLVVLKNSLAVIAAPGLQAIAVVLRGIASAAMTAANMISHLMAILGGKSSYRAVIWADTLADAEKNAGSSAKEATKEFKKQLMAFDEINNITEQTKGSSGGGGGSSSKATYSDMFETRSVDKSDFGYFSKWIDLLSAKLKSIKEHALDFWNALKKVFENTDYRELLDGLGECGLAILTLVDDTLKWAAAFVKTKEFATGVQIAVDLIGAIFKGAAGMVYTFEAAIKISVAAVQWLGDVTSAFFKALWASLTGKKDAWNTFDAEVSRAGDLFRGRVTSAVNELNDRLDYITGKKFRINMELNEVQKVTRYITEVSSNIGMNAGAYYTKYATGGMPSVGEVFIAREAGPELVGTIGGQSAVVNNNDIVASVSQGVASAVASVLGGGQQVNVTLEGDAKGLFKVVQRESRAYSARTGQLAMA